MNNAALIQQIGLLQRVVADGGKFASIYPEEAYTAITSAEFASARAYYLGRHLVRQEILDTILSLAIGHLEAE